jgi:uncharacterized repeat protein (TIGR01451 family)
VLALAVLLAGALTAFGDTTAVSTFSKSATDPTTSSTATGGGAAGSTKAGDTINWVLHYQNNTGANANVSITDPITGNQSFVPGSLQTPPGLSPRWSTNGGSSYVTTEPGSGVNAVGANGTVPAGTTNATGSPFTTNTLSFTTQGGDGYSIEGAGSNLYTVLHHTTLSTTVFCATLDNQKCSGWPANSTYVDPTPGTPIGTGTSGQYATADSNGSFIANGRLYWPVEATTAVAGSYPLGVQCLDLTTQKSCGFVQLDTAALAPASTGTAGRPVGRLAADGLPAANGDYYLFDGNGLLMCFDPSTNSGCGTKNVTGGAPVQDPGAGGLAGMLTLGSQVYVAFVSLKAGVFHNLLTCYDTSTSALCGTSPSPFPADDGPSLPGLPYADFVAPVLSTAGLPLGACDVFAHKCYDPTGAALANPYPGFNGFGLPGTVVGFGSGAVVGARYYAGDLTSGKIDCFDFSVWSGTGAVPVCAGYTAPSNAANYTVRALANLPGCLAADGDAAQITVFDQANGGSCTAASAQTSVNLSSYYCDGQAGHAQSWGQLRLNGLDGSEFASATLTLSGKNGPIPGYTNLVLAPGQTSINLGSLPVTGATSSLTAQIALAGVHNAAKVNAATVTLDWQGDPVEVCYQTRVGPTTCSSSIQLSDTANAVTNAGAGASDAPGGNGSGTVRFNEANDQALCVDLGVTKTATPFAPPGGALSWTFKVVNNGPGDSTGYTVVDTAPPGVSNLATSSPGCSVSGLTVTCTHGSLAAGGSVSYSLTGNAPNPFPAAITNSATVTGNETDLNPNNNTDTAKTTPSQPSVTITKVATVSPAADQAGVKVGDVIAYTYTVKNTGNVNLKTVSVNDPAIGTVSCPVPPDPGLAPEAAETCTADAAHTVTQADVDAGQIVDTATASCGDVTGGSCQPSPPSQVTIPATPPHPTVSIQKIAHASGGDSSPIKVGDTISYSYVVTNTGNVTLSSVSVNDPTVGSVTCPSLGAAGLAPGGSVTCTGDQKHTVSQADVDAGQVTDTATAGCKDIQGGSCPPSPPSEVGVPSAPDPKVAIVKTGTVTPATDQNGVMAGDTIAYSYKVTNVGNVTLKTVSVEDPTIGTVSCPTPAAPGLPVGGSLTCTATATHTVTQAEVDAGSVMDTGTAGCTDTQGRACPPSNPSTVTLPATDPQPSVSIVKSATVTPAGDQNAAKVGDTIAYSYKVTNTGNVTLPTVSVDDPTDGHVTCPTAAAPGLAPGASVTCTADTAHTVTQADVDAGKIVDSATAGCADTKGTPCPPSPPSKVTVPPVPGNPAVTIVKSATVSPSADQTAVKVGDEIFYTYEVKNTGNVSLQSVSVDDPTDAPVDCPTLLAPGLAPGDSVACSARSPHLVTQADVDAGHVDDTATAGCTDVQGNACSKSPPSSVSIPAVNPDPKLSIQKIADAANGDNTPISLNETIKYSYLVTNTGNVTVNAVAVSDPTAGTVTCPQTTLAPGDSETCTADSAYTVTQTDVDHGSVTDTASVGCKDPSGANCPSFPPSHVTVPSSPAPAVAIDKRAAVTPAADQQNLKVGDLIAYTYTVTNVGNTTLATVSVNDPSISATCPDVGAGLAPGDSVTCESDVSYVVSQADIDAGGVTDTATASCVDVSGGSCTPSPPSTVSVPAIPSPHVTIVKTGTVSPAADQDGAQVGDKITYSYLVTNTGNTTLTTVSVDDPSIGSVTCPSGSGLAPGDSETCTADAQYTVTQADVDSGKLVDTAAAGCVDKAGDACPPGDPSQVTIPPVPPAPSVSIHKTGSVTPSTDQSRVKVGDTITYSYLVTNTGNVTLDRVSVSDPAGGSVTCPTPQAPGLAPGASITCTADQPHTVNQADVDNEGVTDFATASCTDTNGSSCPQSPPSKVLQPADPKRSVSLVKTATVNPASDQNQAKFGDVITYTYKVTNTGNVDLKFVRVSDPSLGAVTCPIPAPPGLAPGASETCTGDVAHVVNVADVRAGKVNDTATASGTDNNGKDTGPSNPSSTHTPVLHPSTKLTITKTVNARTAVPGQPLTYTITVTNHGSVDAPDVQVVDKPSIPLRHVHVHSSQGSCETGPPLTCMLGTIKAGAHATITLTGTPARDGKEHNTATVTFAGHDTAHAVAGVTTHVSPILLLRKVPSRKTVKAGQSITYTLRVTNPTREAVKNVSMCDSLPGALIYVRSSPSAHRSAGRYCWSIGRLASHRSWTVTLIANAAPGKGGHVINHATVTAAGVPTVRTQAAIYVQPAKRIGCGSSTDAARAAGARRAGLLVQTAC